MTVTRYDNLVDAVKRLRRAELASLKAHEASADGFAQSRAVRTTLTARAMRAAEARDLALVAAVKAACDALNLTEIGG